MALPRGRDRSVLPQGVGWAGGPTIHHELVLNALASAVKQRRPRRTNVHSDQGTHFGSDAWRRFCRSNRLEPSMSRNGNCWDNAVAASFFSSFKNERINERIYASRDVALTDIADYIDTFYNRTRWHSHIGGVSPEQCGVTHKPGRRRVSSFENLPALHESLATPKTTKCWRVARSCSGRRMVVSFASPPMSHCCLRRPVATVLLPHWRGGRSSPSFATPHVQAIGASKVDTRNNQTG